MPRMRKRGRKLNDQDSQKKASEIETKERMKERELVKRARILKQWDLL